MIDYVAAKIGQTHVRASAAIPILFPPVRVTTPAAAAGWYVDGGTRLNTPIKPAIDLGAKRAVVIGTGSVTPVAKHEGRHDAPAPDFGVSALHLLEGALGDPLVEDLRNFGDIRTPSTPTARAPLSARVTVSPAGAPGTARSRTLRGPVARGGDRRAGDGLLQLPLRRAEGAALARPDRAQPAARPQQPDARRAAQYLFFDPEFIKGLVEMGRNDARAWLDAPPGPSEPWQLEPLEALTGATR